MNYRDYNSVYSFKGYICPTSGYLTRQISFVLNNFVYHEGEDKTNEGLLIPRYKALGRTAPNGKVYPNTPIAKGDENDLVPVRSIVTKVKGDLNVVTPDLIGHRPGVSDFTDGAAIGLSFATSFTEGTTQAALGLKHGGHERVLDKSGYLVADKPCTFSEEGKWIYLKVRGAELKYPRPDNLVTLGKTKFEKGENICVAYNTSSPIVKVNTLINLMNAKGGNGTKYFEKETINVADCYAYDDGIIKYTEDNKGEIHVFIGNQEYQYNPRSMYYFPDGAQVHKFDKICSGVVNMRTVSSVLGPKRLNDIYLIFRKQMYTLTDDGYMKTGLSSLDSTPEEIIELLFVGLTKLTYGPKDKLEEIQYQGAGQSVLNKKSFYTVLSYGYSSKIVDKALKGDVDLSGDVIIKCCPKLNKIKNYYIMNYKKIYDDLMDSRKKRGLDKSKLKGEYYEIHHIVPKCLNGPDTADNKVLLTAREHLLAHILLSEIYPDNSKLLYSILALTKFDKTLNRGKDVKFVALKNSKLIATLREKAYSRSKIDRSGENNPMYNRKHTEESRKKMSERELGEKHWNYNGHLSEEHKEKIRKSLKNRKRPKFTKEHCDKISKSRLGKFTGEANPFFNKHHTDEVKKRLSIKRREHLDLVIDPSNEILSVVEMAKKYLVSYSTIVYWIEKHPEKGFKFYKKTKRKKII